MRSSSPLLPEPPADSCYRAVRRSSRQRLEPLEYWRNERVIYKRRPSGVGINAVVRIPKPIVESLSKAGRKGFKRAASHVVKNEVPEEEGIDDMTDETGVVWSWEGNAETTRSELEVGFRGEQELMRRLFAGIAFTKKMIDPRPTHDNSFMFQKIYTELDYFAGGILQIPVGGEKPQKPAKDNSYVRPRSLGLCACIR